METVLQACEQLAEYHSFFTVNNLSIKLGNQFTREELIQILSEIDEIHFLDGIIFMKDFAKYADLFTLDLGVLALLHMAVDPKNANIQDFLLKKIRIIRSDL